jgi:hypothetical protein
MVLSDEVVGEPLRECPGDDSGRMTSLEVWDDDELDDALRRFEELAELAGGGCD